MTRHRSGAVLIVVVGLAAMLVSLALAYLARARALLLQPMRDPSWRYISAACSMTRAWASGE